MTMTTTSEIRIDHLVELSDKVYRAIDERINNETRARRIVRQGIQIAACMLETSSHHAPTAGDYYHALLHRELSRTLTPSDYAAWPRYQARLATLPQLQPHPVIDVELDRLACAYADVRRKTIGADGEDETDASHAVHLSAIALPYAAEYYPELDQSTIALYCLVHDIVEAYAGDTPSLGMSSTVEACKHAREAAALQQITDEFQSAFPRFVAMIHTYETLADDEAKFVKTFDKLDPGFTHVANDGLALRKYHSFASADELLTLIDQITVRMRPYADKFPMLMKDRVELTRRIVSAAAL